MSADLDECFPAAAEVARLAENAQAGRREAFVGTGDPDTVLACPHAEVRLGDVLDQVAAEQAAADAPTCTATTAKGDPCKGRPGDDGLCAAHKDQG